MNADAQDRLKGGMASEKEKMLAGELYDPFDAELAAARERARLLCHELNSTSATYHELRRSVVTQSIPEGMFAAGYTCRVIRPLL